MPELKRPVTIWLRPSIIEKVDRIRGELSRSKYIGIAIDTFLEYRKEGEEIG